MCLAVPGKVLEIVGDDPLLRAAKVSFAGVIKLISLTCTPEAYLQQMGELDGLEIPASPVAPPPDEPRHSSQSEGGRITLNLTTP
jgi:hypothetical protein